MQRTVVESLNRLMITHKSLHRLYLEKLGLFFGLPRLMYQIKIHPQLSQQKLGERLGVSKEAVSVSVRRLEKKGYIKRETDPSDKRKVLLSLTQSGHDILDEVLIHQNAAYEQLLEPLNDDQRQHLQTLLELMLQNDKKEDKS